MREPRPRNFSPFPYADDHADADTVPHEASEDAIPLLTPFQRYMLEGIDSLKRAQGEFTAELVVMRAQLTEMAPLVKHLESDAALLKKVLSYAKYFAVALASRYFPEAAKHIPDILKVIGP